MAVAKIDVIETLRERSLMNNGASFIQTPNQGFLNEPDSPLRGIDCPICGNRGQVMRTDENGVLWVAECSCMAKRRTLRNIRNSGLLDMCERYTFDAYTTPTPAEQAIKHGALGYCADIANGDRPWYYICGKPGSGKTHICVAICNALMEQGKELRYMLWRDDSTRIKGVVSDSVAYRERIEPLKNVEVLYIDDFFKGKVSEADLNLAFEIINARYNDRKKITIISSERSAGAILSLDEAIGRRIIERARGNCFMSPDADWSLKNGN